MSNPNHKLLPAEQACLDHLAKAWNTFVGLEHANPDMVTEFRHGIHALQNEIMARPTRRYIADSEKSKREIAAIFEAVKSGAMSRNAGNHLMNSRCDVAPLCHMNDRGEWIVADGCAICKGTGRDPSRDKSCDGIPF